MAPPDPTALIIAVTAAELRASAVAGVPRKAFAKLYPISENASLTLPAAAIPIAVWIATVPTVVALAGVNPAAVTTFLATPPALEI